MGRFAKIQNDTVINVAIASAAFDGYVEVPDDVGVGWTHNEDDTYSPPVVEVPVPTRRDLESSLRTFLDGEAITLGYDSITVAATYADEAAVSKYQTEGIALRAWRSEVWEVVEQIFSDIDAETRTQPTIDEFIAELPAYTG